jgi:two-component system sensor histidine kinase BaeS
LSEAGVLKLQREATDLTALARDAARAFAAEAATQRVTINVNGADSVIAEVDPVRIREVLANLLSNSLRHTGAAGAVTISIAREEKERVSVAVTDTGAGMTAEETQHAFERFYKGPGSRGSGLGLAIAQGLVVAHGGSIGIASETGRGTTIVFTIPT